MNQRGRQANIFYWLFITCPDVFILVGIRVLIVADVGEPRLLNGTPGIN
jgi:hypothetical protein